MTTTTDKHSIQDRVTAICNELYAKGTKPSVRIVLSMLPDVSSTSTVHKYFATWRTELEASQQSLYDKLGFSSEFTQSFMKEITRFGVEAEQRYKTLSVDADEQRDLAIEELERSEERLYKQSASLEQGQKEIAELQKELFSVRESMKADLAKEQETNRVIVQELREQLADTKSIGKELALTNEALRTEIAKAELKLEGNQLYVLEVKEQNQAVNADNKALNQTISELNRTLAGCEAKLEGNVQLIASLESSRVEQQASLSKANDEHQVLSLVLSTTRQELDASRVSVSELKDKLNAESTLLVETKSAMAELTRGTEKTLASYEAAIKGNEKLIAQLESKK